MDQQKFPWNVHIPLQQVKITSVLGAKRERNIHTLQNKDGIMSIEQ